MFQLAIQMDALEQYVKIEKLDPAQISEASVQHKEQKWGQMTSVYTDVESKGKSFIEDASQVGFFNPYSDNHVYSRFQHCICQVKIYMCLPWCC